MLVKKSAMAQNGFLRSGSFSIICKCGNMLKHMITNNTKMRKKKKKKN